MARGWFLIGFTNRRSMRATRFDPKLISLSLAHRWFSFCFNEPPRWFRVGIKWVWCDLFVVIRPLIGRFGARSNDQDGTSIRPSLLIGLINRWIDSFCVTTRPFCGHRFVARLSFVLFLPPVLSSMAVSGEIKKLFVLMFSGRPSWIECTRKLFRGLFFVLRFVFGDGPRNRFAILSIASEKFSCHRPHPQSRSSNVQLVTKFNYRDFSDRIYLLCFSLLTSVIELSIFHPYYGLYRF